MLAKKKYFGAASLYKYNDKYLVWAHMGDS